MPVKSVKINTFPRVGFRGLKLFVFLVFVACSIVAFVMHTSQVLQAGRQSFLVLSPEDEMDGNDGGQRQLQGGLHTTEVNLTLVEQLVRKYRVVLEKPLQQGQGRDLYALADKWVTEKGILPEYAPELGAVLNAMATDPIVSIDNGPGNQLKFTITLNGGQTAIFKPKWYEMDMEWTGENLCTIHDSPFAEIAAFHLSRVLELRKTPLSVGRTLSLKEEILPLATQRLNKTTFKIGNMTCLYGDCAVCHKTRPVCTNDTLDGVMILWLSKRVSELHHPWRKVCRPEYDRLFSDGEQCARSRLEFPFNIPRFFLDLVESTVFHYLITNADRKTHPIKKQDGHVSRVMMLSDIDNGKSFHHPDRDEPKILAPLFQCCFIRNTTYQRLQLLGKGVLSRVMKAVLSADPLSPVLTDRHLLALDRRLEHVLYEIHKCVRIHGARSVLSS